MFKRMLCAWFCFIPAVFHAMAMEIKPPSQDALRVATFNCSLYRPEAGRLIHDLENDDAQAHMIAEIIQAIRADVMLLNEFDYDESGRALSIFNQDYLGVPHHGSAPLDYPYRYPVRSNTGVPSGKDLNGDGEISGGNDALGFGQFEGQYAFAIISRYPLDVDKQREFGTFLWRDMPGALLPDSPDTPQAQDFYTPEMLAILPLSSKNHIDLPVHLPWGTLHVLASHPTPPTFDGPEDRNGKRNFDEIRLWKDYISGEDYLYDQYGIKGGLKDDALFVVMGDLNADPFDGDSYPGAIMQLLEQPRLHPKAAVGEQVPASEGAAINGAKYGPNHKSAPSRDTAAFAGGLRVDYVLPSNNVTVTGSGVFWPAPDDSQAYLVARGDHGWVSSDHHAVWVDIQP